MALPALVALQAYRHVDSGAQAATGGADFSAAMTRALSAVVDTSRTAEAGAMQAIAGGGNITDVVTAVAKAELALQTTVAVRDRVVQAYQEIMRMPI
jgi:flagellar hook-basal body complex protein FliE